MKRFMKIMLIITMISPLIGVIITSCTEDVDCSLTRRSELHSKFYISEGGTGTQASLTITAFGTDSVILNQESNVTNFALPLQYTVDTTALVLHFEGGYRDTIVFKHTNTPYFISMDCGYEMRQAVTDFYYTTHILNSVVLIDKNANKDGNENLQFYYTPN